ncbi:MAG: sigma-70 family RNA polymerase sigma factor [Actinobacteria bacterium]|nr:sigma-70 family RNA polymerase sigma factor [Actinomycetota bacterium]
MNLLGSLSLRETRELVEYCQRLQPRLLGMLSLYCGTAELAEELAQETLARVCRDWQKVSRMDHPDAWTHRVALNLAKSHFRRFAAERRARRRLEGRQHFEAYEPDTAAAIAVRSAVSRLPTRQREILLLHYYVGFTFAEAAEVLGVPASTLKSLAHRAVKRLRSDSRLVSSEEAFNGT